MSKAVVTKEVINEQLMSSLKTIVEDTMSEHFKENKEEVVDTPFENLKGLIRDRKFEIKEDQKGIAAARVVRALAFANNDLGKAKHFIKKMYDDALGDEIQKTLVSAVLEQGGALVMPEYASEVIELLRSKTAVRKAGARSLPMNNGTLTIRKQTSGSSASYVGESENIGVTQPGTGQIELVSKKLAAIVPISNDLLMFTSGPSADEFVRDDLVMEIAIREDQAFLRDDGSQHTPRGMRYWAVGNHVQAISGTTAALIEADLKDMINDLESDDVRMIRPVWFMHPSRKNHLSILRDGSGGNLLYPELRGSNPVLWGYPVMTTTSIPQNLGGGTESEVMLADMADAIIGEVNSLQIAVDPSASYVDGGSLVSAFSKDETLVRAISRHDFAFRHQESISVRTGVTWGA